MKLVRISSQEDADHVADDIEAVRELGFEHVAYAGVNPLAQSIHGHVTYGPEWSAYYADNDLQANDPILLRAGRSVAPVDWDRLRCGPGRAVFERARDFGLPTRGMTIPVRGLYGDVGLLSVSGSRQPDWAALVRARLGDLQSYAVRVHDRIMSTDPLMRTLTRPTLSKREREVLQWAAAGRTQSDVATILGISVRTVEVHMNSARVKLGALSTSQAVGRAIALGLIYPE